jgi:hypothetical protein
MPVVATPLSPTKNDCTMSMFLLSQYLGFVDYRLSKAAGFGLSHMAAHL